MTETRRFDVAIVGGGLVGLTLALALTRFVHGLEVAVLDRRPLGAPADGRASAIAAGVRRLFEGLGVWEQLAPEAEPVRTMKITDSGNGDIARPLFLRFEGEVAPGEPFAHMVPNALLHRVLLDALAGRIRALAPATLEGTALAPGVRRLMLSGGAVAEAPVVVAADGGNSFLRHLVGIKTLSRAYAQAGLVATIAHELPHEGTAFEHFRPNGPFASLPLRGERSSLVWTETPENAARYAAMAPEDAAQEIEAAMGACLGAVRLEDSPQVFPLHLRIARQFIAPRLALVGDAAHVIHPIAGQGLNLGLRDVAALAECIVEALRLGLDPGSDAVLGRYQGWRRLDTGLMVLVTDGMNTLFSNDVAPVRAVRDLGLSLIERMDGARGLLIRSAAGIGGQGAPRLLSGLPL